MGIMEKLKKVREAMREVGIDAYYVTASDYHQSEYIGDFFKIRQYITGFTGSFGNFAITMDSAALWTDGRYEVQANEQLKETGIIPFVLGKKETPDFKKWIAENVKAGAIVGFDGRCISSKVGIELKNYFETKGLRVADEIDIADKFWKERPRLACTPAFILPEGYTGKSYKEKIAEVREKIKNEGATKNILITLDDIAWLYNLRGRDIKNTPVSLAYAIVGNNESILYIEKSKIQGEVQFTLEKDGVEIREYEKIYQDIREYGEEERILIDSTKMNFAIFNRIVHCNILDVQLPTTLLKGVKNDIEIENTKYAHIKDGVAVTKFTYWLKKNIVHHEISELEAARKIEELRAEQDGYIEPSFNTISAYMSNAAMPHYSATPEKFSVIKKKGLYLVDSGGQYFDGTTDITRTIAVGELSAELKRDYTLVLKGMLNLSMAKFLNGTTGTNLDILARSAMWKEGINFNHGTGHGIGHVLGVHEGPHGIRMAYNPFPLIPGMIVTNEPAIYIPGAHGIRIENELLVTDYMETVFGKFYQFETLTFVPIDLDAIEVSMLSNEEREYLNSYHREVFKKISPYLGEDESMWLKEYTRAI